MKSNLQPDQAEKTNALLSVLIEGTFRNKSMAINSANVLLQGSDPGPSSFIIGTQALGYISLFLSLLAAFGVVLGKQWLGHFKTTRFGHGTLKERGMRRHRCSDAIKKWHLGLLLDLIPALLQLSLFLFGVSLAMNIYSEQKILGGLIMALISIALILYVFTFIIAIQPNTSPFETGLTVLTRSLLWKGPLSSTVAWVLSWRVFQSLLPLTMRVWRPMYLWISSSCISKVSWMKHFGFPIHSNSPTTTTLEEVELSNIAIECASPVVSEVVELLPAEDYVIPFPSEMGKFWINIADKDWDCHKIVIWVIETTTDPDAITVAAEMVPFIFWPPDHEINITKTLQQLQYTFDGCFDSRKNIIGKSWERAQACFIATFYLYHTQILKSHSQPDDSEDWCGHWLQKCSNIIHQAPQLLAIHDFFKVIIQPGMYLYPLITLEDIPSNDLVWVIHIINTHIARQRQLGYSKFPPEMSYRDNIIKGFCYIATHPFIHSAGGHFLLGLAMLLGFEPDKTFLALPSKRYDSPFELNQICKCSLNKT